MALLFADSGKAAVGFIQRLVEVEFEHLMVAGIGFIGVVHLVIPATGVGAGALVRIAVIEITG